MDIKEIKFDIGQEVYVLKEKEKSHKIPCPICEGKGKVIIKNKSFDCPQCSGRKFTYQWFHYGWTIVKVRITDVELFFDGNNKKCVQYYWLGASTFNDTTDNCIFLSKKEAQMEANKRNKIFLKNKGDEKVK